jgi:uncharacterized membrane protein AbrB (regulator of aidB expression)
LLVSLLGLRTADVVVAFAPGAQETMMVLALSLHLDPVFIGAHHVSRYMIVSLALPLLARLTRPKPKPAGEAPARPKTSTIED